MYVCKYHNKTPHFVQLINANKNKKLGVSRGRAPAKQAWGPEFNLQYIQKPK
jgi:hypothetical protein